jgi:hypothetical protein
MFQLTPAEAGNLKSHIAISSGDWGGRRSSPLVFTEQGVAMLSSVLNSERAIRVNIEIMRAFVSLRKQAILHADIARRLDKLERKYNGRFRLVFAALRQLMTIPEKPKRRIGFRTGDENGVS